MTKPTDLPCGCIRPKTKPRLRLVKANDPLASPINPANVIPMSSVFVEARRLALNEAKEACRRQGLRPQYMEVRELSEIARAFFDEHREQLLAQARENLARR
jgi:hypothetical protein